MKDPLPGTDAWLALVVEDIVDPDQRIIDPHHHLWQRPDIGDYVQPQLHADTESGHRIEQTVFVECGASYRQDGPEHLRVIGETEFVVEVARQTHGSGGAEIRAIVARADLRLPPAQLDEVLDAHVEAGAGMFRGIRHALARARYPQAMTIPGAAPEGLGADPDFRRGVARLGARGLTYDSWHYHHQMDEFLDLVRACPETTCVLDHFATPVGVGPFAGEREAIFEQWRKDMATLAREPNVVAKLGGLAMPDNGFGWDKRAAPPTSDEFVAAQARWFHHTIDCFGPERCMFESNFPVDRRSISYPVLYNGLKKIAARYTAAERDAMFLGTAARVYGLTT
ncbi:MAG TPA: amidohydrolase family protein [Pseudomonadales bacterium]|nr:amidohydrolase family protein [Pseudomonadales bacterium]